MGLDITAYRQIEKLDAVFDAHGEPIDPQTREPLDYDMRAYINDNFPGRANEIEDRAIYRSKDSFGFRAGGYGGYNSWRDELAKIAGWPLRQYERHGRPWDSHCIECWNGKDGPFSELINFSDCEGVIGAAVSAKLAKDFAGFDTAARDSSDSYFYELYSKWRQAFEMAADAGAVQFH